MTSTLGFTPGQPPEWDVERFMRGDEVATAVTRLERNRRTFARKCAEVDGRAAPATRCVVGDTGRSAQTPCLGGRAVLPRPPLRSQAYGAVRPAGHRARLGRLALEHGVRRRPRRPGCALARHSAPLPRRVDRGLCPPEGWSRRPATACDPKASSSKLPNDRRWRQPPSVVSTRLPNGRATSGARPPTAC
jgi:hypothetical protein